MTGSVDLTLVIHNHQPVGNFDHVFHEACDRAYLPFLRLLAEFPAVRIGLHTSGCLWEWLEANRPEYGELVAELLAAGQVELLGGGMYEPILPVLPRADALWQLERLSGFLRQRFGVQPAGMWVPERVWEPHLPEVIAAAGLRYCLLDDFHFGGCAPDELVRTGYFTTEHAGAQVAVLPISQKLRYTIPFRPVEETLEYLHQVGATRASPENLPDSSGTGDARLAPTGPLVVFGDDGEKFGIWPDTYEWVYEKGWLRELFSALSSNADWIRLRLPGEVVTSRDPAGVAYIPARSYREMGEWTRIDSVEPHSVAAQHSDQYSAGTESDATGHWRNFFAKYPESRALQARVQGVSERLRSLADPPLDALDDIGRAQCNCPYWHGVFGGLYLNYLRQAVTQHLLNAELALVENKNVTVAAASSRREEQDGGKIPPPQGILGNSTLRAEFEPACGLSLTRLDYYPTLFCWTDVLARRREHYHYKLAAANAQENEREQASIHDRVVVKEVGLEHRLVFDAHPRTNFTTYCCDALAPEQFMFVAGAGSVAPQLSYEDYFIPAELEKPVDAAVSGKVSHGGFTLHKRAELTGTGLELSVSVEGSIPDGCGLFYVEFNLTVLTDQARDRYMELDGERQSLAEGKSAEGVRSVALVDGWQQRRLTLTPSQPARLLSYPVYTVSSSEGGFERTYQGTCVMLGFPPAGLREVRVTLAIEEA